MTINQQLLEQIKLANPVERIIEERGIKLIKRGSNLVGLCPFHNDTKPSLVVNIKKQLWNCFGCNGDGSSGGDVIKFVMKFDNISFKQALGKLGNRASYCQSISQQNKEIPETIKQKIDTRNQNPEENQSSNLQIVPSSSSESLTVTQQKLLNRVMEFYHSIFYEDRKGYEYLLNERNIKDKNIYETFKIGFSNGTLLKAIPEVGEIVEDLKTIGILNAKGNEFFFNCVVFPIFDNTGNCAGMYGRRVITTNGDTPNHLYLKGPHRGVFNHHGAKLTSNIILTEGIIDALSIYNAGYKNVIPLYGIEGLTSDHITLFKDSGIKEIYLCLDSDDSGKRAAETLSKRLESIKIKTYKIELPTKDANDYFKQYTPADFANLLKAVNPETETQRDNVAVGLLSDKIKEEIETLKDGFIACYSDRKYFIRLIERTPQRKLRANIKTVYEKRFHLDTVDLYSFRSRKVFIREASLLFKEVEEIIEEDINRIIQLTENYINKQETAKAQKNLTTSSPLMTEQEKEEALRFLKSPNLLNELLKDFETIGCIGEETNKLVCYLAVTSRKLDDPLSVLIMSRSSAGKSSLQDACISLVPPEDLVKYTRITGQALFYKEENSLAHKVLAVEEEEGSQDASYSIRAIQSSKILSIASTGKDPLSGKMRTDEYKVKGPLSVLLTTTDNSINPETASRFIFVTVDESKEQTRLIHEKQREARTIEGIINRTNTERIIKKHQNAQRLLQPLKVANPYALLLSFMDNRISTRRDNQKYLTLIDAVCFLHQYQREVKQRERKGEKILYVEVTLQDIHTANCLAHEVFGHSLDELTPPARRLLNELRNMVSEFCKTEGKERKSVYFTRRQMRKYTHWSDTQIRTYLRELISLEYILSVSCSFGKPFAYELIYDGEGEEGQKFMLGLVNIEQLKEKAKAVGMVVK